MRNKPCTGKDKQDKLSVRTSETPLESNHWQHVSPAVPEELSSATVFRIGSDCRRVCLYFSIAASIDG